MTRILIVHPRPTRGGFSAVVAQCQELVALGEFEVVVAVADGERVAELDAAVTVEILRRSLTVPAGLIGLRQLIRRVRPDVIHLHGRQAGILGRIVIPQGHTEVLYTPHGTPWSGGRWMRDVLADAVERALLARTSHVLCVSRAEQADWSRRDPTDRVLYFPNLIDLDPDGESPATPAGAEGRKILDLVLVPSGYHPQKRIEVVIEALALAAEPRPRVLVTGTVDDPSYRDSLARLTIELGLADHVEFAERAPNVKQLMSEAGLVVLPSYTEGLPIVGQEAIAVGANVAWSAIPPHFELFGNAGTSFWTAAELAAVLASDPHTASTSGRRSWLLDQQEAARSVRADFWAGRRRRRGRGG